MRSFCYHGLSRAYTIRYLEETLDTAPFYLHYAPRLIMPPISNKCKWDHRACELTLHQIQGFDRQGQAGFQFGSGDRVFPIFCFSISVAVSRTRPRVRWAEKGRFSGGKAPIGLDGSQAFFVKLEAFLILRLNRSR